MKQPPDSTENLGPGIEASRTAPIAKFKKLTFPSDARRYNGHDASTTYAELIDRAGLPEGVLQVVLGDGPTVGNAVLERADYVMFGEPEADGSRPSFAAILERVGWWAELFEVPCVAYAATPDEVGQLAAAGADFVAVGGGIWDHPKGPAAAVAEAAAKLAVPEKV